MTALYSEFDPKAAAWLRELIKQGHIADGIVDERDLWDVPADYLAQFTQVHLCAGIGVWSYALRRAGWDDSRPVWTGSFPCQPFSAAGKGLGFADERHLWPAGEHIIRQCRPRAIFGEQVASKDAEPWLDAVQADLEGLGYAFGACAFPSAGIGAPHIRDRTYWVADAGRECGQPDGLDVGAAPRSNEGETREWERLRSDVGPSGYADGLANNNNKGLEGRRQPGRERAAERPAGAGGVAGWLAHGSGDGRREERADAGRQPVGDRPEGLSAGLGAGDSDSRMADASSARARGEPGDHAEAARLPQTERQSGHRAALPERAGEDGDGRGVHGSRLFGDGVGPGPTNGLWRDADWLLCRDGKWRPVEPGTFPLAHGAPARVGRLRGYGNAINAEAAIAWIEAYLDAEAERLRLTNLYGMTSPNVFD